MALTQNQIELIRAGVRKREQTSHAPTIRGIDRIEISVDGGLHYRAREVDGQQRVMEIDEPPERGGDGTGNSPLGHFLTGAGACLLNQFVRIAVAEGYDLAFTGARIRGEFSRDAGGALERITSEIHADGAVDSATAELLTQRAEALCYIHNTLSRAVQMTTLLYLNGQEAVRKVSQPERT
jgi:uncharacterized OsmC-like protein